MTDLIARAIALREAQDIEAALEVIGEAAKKAPNDPRAHWVWRRLVLKLGDQRRSCLRRHGG